MLDRTGDEVVEDEHVCDGGWLDRDAERPRPCLVCRPHLAPHRLRARTHGLHDPIARETRERNARDEEA